MKRVCLVPRMAGVGGMVSFQFKLAAGLAKRGVETCFDLDDLPYEAVLVTGGTRHLAGLRRARQRGARIVQRLDGMNWLHRRRRTGLRHFLRAEWGNWLLTFTRSHLADEIVYQSGFSRRWWESARGQAPVSSRIVYNGVELDVYSPLGRKDPTRGPYRLLLVEGSLMGGYELGLDAAFDLAQRLAARLVAERQPECDSPLELVIAGRISAEVQARWTKRAGETPVRWAGLVPQAQIPDLDRSAHLLYSADINAACPNAVIEALACGLPVLAFDTGALPELVKGDAGRVVPYGGDPWRLDPPDVAALAEGALEILQGGDGFREAARRQAEASFGLDEMVNGYLEALAGEGEAR